MKKFHDDSLRENSNERYADVVEQFERFTKKSKDKFSFSMIRDFLSTIQNPNTHNVSLHALKKYFKQRYENKSLTEQAKMYRTFSSIKERRVQKSVGKDNYFYPAEVKALMDSATFKNACFIEALFYSGSRISALLNTKLTDCEIIGTYVQINTTAKCDIPHKIIIPLPLYTKILNTFHGKVYLFETVEGRKYSREYVSREIKDTGKAINVKANCHKFRHSLAMHLKAQGFSADEIANTLGHQGVLTTLEHYFHGTIPPEKHIDSVAQALSNV